MKFTLSFEGNIYEDEQELMSYAHAMEMRSRIIDAKEEIIKRMDHFEGEKLNQLMNSSDIWEEERLFLQDIHEILRLEFME